MSAINALVHQEFQQNWLLLLIAFVCMLFAFSAPALLIPFIYADVIEEFGWSREQVTFLASTKYLTGAVVAIVIGRVIDAIGVRRVLITVSAAGGLALLSFLWTPGLVAYYAAGVMLGIAGAGTMVSIKVLVSRTFHARQGTAMGLAMLGTSIGSILLPMPITFLIELYGWRIGTAMMSAGVWLIALPLMTFFVNDRFFDQDNAPRNKARSDASYTSDSHIRELLSQPRYWLIAAAVFAAGFVDQALIQHQVLYLRTDLGLNATYVAAGISAIGLVGLIARPMVGAIFDRWSVNGVSAIYVILAAGAGLALAAIHPAVFAVFVVFRAVGHASVLLDTTILAKHTYGLGHIGVSLGILTAAVNLGFATGTWVVARMYAIYGSYDLAFVLCVVVGLAAAAVLLPVQPRFWQAQVRLSGS